MYGAVVLLGVLGPVLYTIGNSPLPTMEPATVPGSKITMLLDVVFGVDCIKFGFGKLTLSSLTCHRPGSSKDWTSGTVKSAAVLEGVPVPGPVLATSPEPMMTGIDSWYMIFAPYPLRTFRGSYEAGKNRAFSESAQRGAGIGDHLSQSPQFSLVLGG